MGKTDRNYKKKCEKPREEWGEKPPVFARSLFCNVSLLLVRFFRSSTLTESLAQAMYCEAF